MRRMFEGIGTIDGFHIQISLTGAHVVVHCNYAVSGLRAHKTSSWYTDAVNPFCKSRNKLVASLCIILSRVYNHQDREEQKICSQNTVASSERVHERQMAKKH